MIPMISKFDMNYHDVPVSFQTCLLSSTGIGIQVHQLQRRFWNPTCRWMSPWHGHWYSRHGHWHRTSVGSTSCADTRSMWSLAFIGRPDLSTWISHSPARRHCPLRRPRPRRQRPRRGRSRSPAPFAPALPRRCVRAAQAGRGRRPRPRRVDVSRNGDFETRRAAECRCRQRASVGTPCADPHSMWSLSFIGLGRPDLSSGIMWKSSTLWFLSAHFCTRITVTNAWNINQSQNTLFSFLNDHNNSNMIAIICIIIALILAW